jgi:hypothetical protein
MCYHVMAENGGFSYENNRFSGIKEGWQSG